MSNYVSNILNSLLLAGALSLGQNANFSTDLNYASRMAATSQSNNHSGFNYSAEPRQESRARSDYARQVDAWFTSLQKTHGSYLPQGMKDLRLLNVSDDDKLEELAFGIYNNVNTAMAAKKHNNEGENRQYKIEQHKLPDGSYLWVDSISGEQLRATKIGHGKTAHFNYEGPMSLILRRGGRGELGAIDKSLEDFDPNHDYPMPKAA